MCEMVHALPAIDGDAWTCPQRNGLDSSDVKPSIVNEERDGTE